jgi:hypothetical protein
MERNATLEAMEQYIALYQQSQQAQEPSMLWLAFVLAMIIFAGIGIVATVKFVYRFIKNGFNLKKPPVTTRYVFVDSAVGITFIAALLSFIALFITRAVAASRWGF